MYLTLAMNQIIDKSNSYKIAHQMGKRERILKLSPSAFHHHFHKGVVALKSINGMHPQGLFTVAFHLNKLPNFEQGTSNIYPSKGFHAFNHLSLSSRKRAAALTSLPRLCYLNYLSLLSVPSSFQVSDCMNVFCFWFQIGRSDLFKIFNFVCPCAARKETNDKEEMHAE